LIRNEPLPKMNFVARKALTLLLKRFPLLICKSPLAFTGGVIFVDDENQSELASALSNAALSVARQQSASFVLFDYLSKTNAQNLSAPFRVISAANPGTVMENKWRSLDDYLAAGDKKDRQHYKRVMREAENLGIKISRHARVEKISDALNLIRSVERTHGALPNPWARPMLEQMEMVNGVFLTATINAQLVGCGLLLEDNHTQMTSLLGLAERVSYVYFMLVYESLKIAFEHQVSLLRWGSGAYAEKQRLGFSLEDNDALAFAASNPTLQNLIRRFI